MSHDPFQLAFATDANVPAPDVPDHVLVRWLRQRLGRAPLWMEVLAFRAGLRERARRRVLWAWWRRLWRPALPRQEDLVADFLRSLEGQTLFRLLGGMAELVAQLALPNPWEGFDGQHPTALRLSRREALRERIAFGCAVPVREQVAAALAYADWRFLDLPGGAGSLTPEAAEFLKPGHAAAINVMTGAAIMGICARLRQAHGGDAARRAVLREMDLLGDEVLLLWPGAGKRGAEVPLGIWPPPADDDGQAAASMPVSPAPLGVTH